MDANNPTDMERIYDNKWVVSKNFRFTDIVAVGDSSDEALENARDGGYKNCFMIYFPGPEGSS